MAKLRLTNGKSAKRNSIKGQYLLHRSKLLLIIIIILLAYIAANR